MLVIHGVFAPCEYLGHKFVDGGVLDNAPAGEVKKLGVDKVLTLRFAASLDYEPKGLYDVVFKCVDIIFEGREKEGIENSDLIINFEMPEANVFNTKKIDYCYNIGYITTLTKIKEIKEMLEE